MQWQFININTYQQDRDFLLFDKVILHILLAKVKIKAVKGILQKYYHKVWNENSFW